MARMTHMVRREATYWFRYRLPLELRGKPVPPAWPEELNALVSSASKHRPKHPASLASPSKFKTELTRSLETREEKVAKGRVLPLISWAVHLCTAARRVLAAKGRHGPRTALTPEESAALANDYRAMVLAIDEGVRKEGFGVAATSSLVIGPSPAARREPGMSDADLAVYEAFVAARTAELKHAMAASRPPSRTRKAAALLAPLALLAPSNPNLPDLESSPGRRDVELDFLVAERRAMQDVAARLDGEVVPTPPFASLGKADGTEKASPRAAHSGPTIREAFERWASGDPLRGARKPSGAGVAEGRTVLARFIELHGDLPIGGVSKRHARELLDGLARVPKGLPPKLSKLPLPVLLKRDLSMFQPRAAATVNKTMQLLGGVFARAEKDGFFDEVQGWSNPFHIRIEVSDVDRESYQPFDVAELSKLFASPVFAEGARPKGGRGDAAFWLPLLSLYTGARRTEIAQLRANDVRKDPDTGVWFIDFHNEDENRIKTRSSIRKTPVHPDLERLGFLAYAQRQSARKGPAPALWPEFEQPVADKAKAWSKWFGRYLADHVVDHPAKTFHSFRGTFKRFARAAGCEEHVIDALVGHSSSSVGRRYGRQEDASGRLDAGFPLARLATEIARVDYAGAGVSLPGAIGVDSLTLRRT